MATRTVLIRTALLLLPAAALAAGTAVPALAGTYDVVTCTTDAQVIPRPPVSGADDAWVTETNDPSHLEFVRRCPPQPAVDLDGMVVRTRLNSGGPVTGAYAHWRFDAPAGTSITRLRFWREIGKRVNDWELYSRTAEGTKLAATDCTRPPDEFTCQVGFPGGPPADWPGLDTTFVRVGMLCVETSCATGATLHEAWTAIYGAKVTVNDPTNPIATGGGGPLFAGGYLRGTVNAALGSASDNTGIRALQVREGATVVAEALQACDYSRRVPCADLTGGGSVSVSTAALADGAHTLAVGATDASGNFSAAASRQVTVDNTAPLAPAPTSPTAIAVSSPSATVTWANPGGQVSPITAAHVTVCGPDGCRETVQDPTGSAAVGLTGGYGAYTVAVALRDAAGNSAPARRAVWNVDYPAPALAPAAPAAAVPGASTTTPAPGPLASPRLALARPTVARDRRTITVRGTVAPGVRGRVTVEASAKIGRRTRTVTRTVTLRGRRYTARLRLPSRAWRTAKVTARYARTSTRRAQTVTRAVRQRTR